VALYGAGAVPVGREAVETLIAPGLLVLVVEGASVVGADVAGADAEADENVIAKDEEAVLPVASVTLNPKVLVPAFTGVPKRMPELDHPRPVLQEPEQEVIDHL
jgi:hypothetical protein